MNLPKLGERRVIFENWYQQLYRVSADFGDFAKEYFVTNYGPRAGVVVLQGNAVLLVSQYRLLINRPSWEIPGGAVDPGETPEDAARRECLEETGVECWDLKPLVAFHPGLDTVYNPTHLFYATEYRDTSNAELHRQEVLGHQWLALDRVLEMIFAQEIMDSLSVIALLAYHILAGRR